MIPAVWDNVSETDQSPEAGRRSASPWLAALLSFLWPGLGQLSMRKRRIAALFAVPPALVLLLLAYELRRGPVVFAAELFANRNVGLAAVAIVVLLGVWRLAAVLHVYLDGERPMTHQLLDRFVVVALAAVIVVSHAGAGLVLAVYSNAGTAVFNPNSSLIDLTTPDPSPGLGHTYGPADTAGPADTSGATPTPTTAPSIDSRVTILFTGVDSAAGRSEHLYDSIMVVSYDPATNSVQMVSVPRDSASFPLYFGNHQTVPVTTRINSLPTYVQNGWIRSPDSPYMTLVKEVSYLVGIPIDYYAVMDFDGFQKMIDMVGGIDVVNQTAISDPTYDWLDGHPEGFFLAAGPQHLDGEQALAFVRSRHGSSDWARSSRQQQVLVALLHKMAQPDQILNLPGLISTVGSSVTTNFPSDQVADYVAIGQDVPSENIRQVVLGPPYTITGVNNVNSAATTCLLNARVAALSIQLFGKDSTWYGKPAPANTCPVKAPTATPTPSASPTPSATPTAPGSSASPTRSARPSASPAVKASSVPEPAAS